MSGLDGKRVLDYGSGHGDITFAISKTNPVIGIDVDSRRVAFARAQYPELTFHSFDGEIAPFADESFDVVVSCIVLPFVEDFRRHICELKRLLKHRGSVILATVNRPVARNFVRRMFGRNELTSSLHLLTPSCTRQLLESFGFEIERSDYFYDPPFADWRTARDVAFGAINQGLSLSHIGAAAPYFAFRAKSLTTSGSH